MKTSKTPLDILDLCATVLVVVFSLGMTVSLLLKGLQIWGLM